MSKKDIEIKNVSVKTTVINSVKVIWRVDEAFVILTNGVVVDLGNFQNNPTINSLDYICEKIVMKVLEGCKRKEQISNGICIIVSKNKKISIQYGVERDTLVMEFGDKRKVIIDDKITYSAFMPDNNVTRNFYDTIQVYFNKLVKNINTQSVAGEEKKMNYKKITKPVLIEMYEKLKEENQLLSKKLKSIKNSLDNSRENNTLLIDERDRLKEKVTVTDFDRRLEKVQEINDLKFTISVLENKLKYQNNEFMTKEEIDRKTTKLNFNASRLEKFKALYREYHKFELCNKILDKNDEIDKIANSLEDFVKINTNLIDDFKRSENYTHTLENENEFLRKNLDAMKSILDVIDCY